MKLYRFSHKTGAAMVSRLVKENGDDVLVKVNKLSKHSKQGDLHNPTETEGVFFHERKALSHFENAIRNVHNYATSMLMYCAMKIH